MPARLELNFFVKFKFQDVFSVCLQILAKVSGLKWQKLTKLADLQKELNLSLEEMEKLVLDYLHAEPYTKTEVSLVNF